MSIEDEPLARLSVSFILDRGTFVLEDDEHYPPGQITVMTDENGYIRSGDSFGVDLWANANNALQVRYECILPNNDRFRFLLASGVGEVNLATLRAASLVPFDEATEVTLQELVDTAVGPLLAEVNEARTALSDGLEKDTLALRLAADFSYLDLALIEVADEDYTPPPRNAILLVNSTDNDVAINLLEAVQLAGRQYLVKLVAGENPVTFAGLDDVVLASLDESVTVLYDGTDWIVLAQYP